METSFSSARRFFDFVTKILHFQAHPPKTSHIHVDYYMSIKSPGELRWSRWGL